MSTTETTGTGGVGATRPLAGTAAFRAPVDAPVERTATMPAARANGATLAPPVERGPASPPKPRRSGTRRVVRRRVTVRRLDPWTILKLSLVFNFCALLVFMVGVILLWSLLVRLEIVDTVLATLRDYASVEVTIRPGNIARGIFLVGVLNAVLFSGINVFLCFLYNLVADLIGGLRMTLAEEE